jgi:hypothetical protein
MAKRTLDPVSDTTSGTDVRNHSRDRFSAYLSIGDTYLKELEVLTLRIAKPAGNKVVPQPDWHGIKNQG